MACLFIYHRLLCNGSLSKLELESILDIDNRITVYNYIKEIQAFIAEFDFYLDEIIEIEYDIVTKKYVLTLKRKKWDWRQLQSHFEKNSFFLLMLIFYKHVLSIMMLIK